MLVPGLAAIVALAGAAPGLAGPTRGGAPPAFQEIFLVDFEGLEEDTILTDQYAALGVSFSMADGADDGPIVAVEGSPARAFSGTSADRPMSSGTGGLTDPLVGGSNGVPAAIRMDFDPPITGARFFLIDVDLDDVFEVTARAGDVVVGVVTVSSGDPSTGNGTSTEVRLEDPSGSITSIVVEPLAEGTNVGWAMDFLTFTRPCLEGTCGPRVLVTQESAPGAGDFDANPLGELAAFPWGDTAATFYAYNIPEGDSWNGPLTLTADRSHLLLANTIEGLSLVMVHDRAIPNDPDGGRAEMRVILQGDDGANILVRDDPASPDAYVGEEGDQEFSAWHAWQRCCTDGWVIGGLECGTLAFVSFDDVDGDPGNEVIAGMNEWVASSAEGGTIPLALEVGRRVRLQVVPDAACPADLNCDDQVSLSDILISLASWGACPACIADIDGDGEVGFEDLLPILSAWGPC